VDARDYFITVARGRQRWAIAFEACAASSK